LALFTYNPNDPGLFVHDSNAVIQNKAGSAGAYLADILFGFFGYLSYLVPISFIVSAFLLFRSNKNKSAGINLGLSVFGVFLALIAGCGLAIMLWPASNLYYGAGGLLGQGMARMLMRLFGDIGATMFLFSGFIAGITLFADIQWLKLIDKIGDIVLSFVETVITLVTSDKSTESTKETKTNNLSSPNNGSSEKDNKSSSIFGAVVAGFSGLTLWKKSSANQKAQTGFQTPRFDPLDDIADNFSNNASDNERHIDESVKRTEPVLGVPEYMSDEPEQQYEEKNVSVSGLKEIITSKLASPKKPEKTEVEQQVIKSAPQQAVNNSTVSIARRAGAFL